VERLTTDDEFREDRRQVDALGRKAIEEAARIRRIAPLLPRFLEDARLPIDNNHDEQQIRPWATGRKNWLFAGTLAAGRRAAVITSLIQSAKLNGHDPYAYLTDVLERLPTQRIGDIGQLLPHRWKLAG